jgi:hypothetical protein
MSPISTENSTSDLGGFRETRGCSCWIGYGSEPEELFNKIQPRLAMVTHTSLGEDLIPGSSPRCAADYSSSARPTLWLSH